MRYYNDFLKKIAYPAQAWFVLSFIFLVLLSWLRYLFSHSIQVDDVVIEGFVGYLLMCLFIGGTIVHFWSYSRVFDANINPLYYIIGLNIIGLFMLPCISNDIYSVLYYGDSFHYDASIYTMTPNTHSIFYESISDLYKNTPSVYGYGTMILAKISILNDILPSVFLFKLYCCLFAIGSGLGLCYYTDIDRRTLWILTLNPIWTIHAIGQSHTEVIAFSIVNICLIFLWNKKQLLAALAFYLAFAVKFSVILLLPILYIVLYESSHYHWRKSVVRIVPIVIGLAIGLLIEMGWTGGLYSLSVPMKTIATLWPSGTFADVIFAIWNMIHHQMTSNFNAITSMESKEFLASLYQILKVVFILFNATIIYRYRTNWNRNLDKIVFGFLVSVLFLYAHRYMTWYLLLLIPIFYTKINVKKYLTPILLLGLVSTLQDTAHYNHLEPIHTIVLAFSIPATIVVQIYLIRIVLAKA